MAEAPLLLQNKSLFPWLSFLLAAAAAAVVSGLPMSPRSLLASSLSTQPQMSWLRLLMFTQG